MSNLKAFSRSVRQQINRISVSLKQMEFKILRMRGFLKKKLREEIMELKRMKDAIMHRLSALTAESTLHLEVMQSIKDDIAILHQRCRQLKTQRL